MPDLRLKQQFTDNYRAVSLDLLLTSARQIDETQALRNAVIIALGTDARALEDDILPDQRSDDRRGWWGDYNADTIWGGWEIGTRLWLLGRASITGAKARKGSTVTRAENYVRDALMPFLKKKMCSKISVVGARNGLGRIDVRVVIYRGPKAAVDLQWQFLWDEIAA